MKRNWKVTGLTGHGTVNVMMTTTDTEVDSGLTPEEFGDWGLTPEEATLIFPPKRKRSVA